MQIEKKVSRENEMYHEDYEMSDDMFVLKAMLADTFTTNILSMKMIWVTEQAADIRGACLLHKEKENRREGAVEGLYTPLLLAMLVTCAAECRQMFGRRSSDSEVKSLCLETNGSSVGLVSAFGCVELIHCHSHLWSYFARVYLLTENLSFLSSNHQPHSPPSSPQANQQQQQ